MRKNSSADRRFRHGAPLLLAITAFGLLVIGCAGVRVASSGATYDSPRTALHELAAMLPAGTITVTARIEISTPSERYPLKAALMMRSPADLRLESIPFIGPPDFFLSIAGGELRVFLPGKGTYHIGPATRSAIARLFRLPLSAAEIVAFLMGRLPDEWEGAHEWYGEQEEGRYRVDGYLAGKKVRSLWIDPAANLLIRVRTFTEEGAIAYTADFADPVRVGGGFLPSRLTISGEGVALDVRYTETGLADDPAAASFALPVPEGIVPTPFDEK